MVLFTSIANKHGLTPEYVAKVFRQLGLPIERVRSPQSNQMCNATTPEGAQAFEQARADAGFHKLKREEVA